MKATEHLHLAALLHDIGKFRMRAIDRYKPHQQHSYEFVTEDFADFFSTCGDAFKDAIRHHHPERYPGCLPSQLQHLIEKQLILADRLSATEREDEEREGEDFVESPLTSILSRLECADQEYRYPLRALDLTRQTIIPTESPPVNQAAYKALWNDFVAAFSKATKETSYTPAAYQTIVALLEKYTSRMPAATPWEKNKQKTVPEISLYDHLRTTAAIAACIGRELSHADTDACLHKNAGKEHKICALIKGDISGIQNFLYQIPSDGAARQLRGRSFYLQLLTEAIAHWVLREFDLPITNLLLASGGHFYILAPDSEAKHKLTTIRRTISEKLWALHSGELSCILAGVSITADFGTNNFSKKWRDVSEKVQQRKQEKWSELQPQDMFEYLFEPHGDKEIQWGFDELGRDLREATHLIAFQVPKSPIPEKHDWRAAIQAFGLDIHLCTGTHEKPAPPSQAQRAIVYRLKDTDFLTDDVLDKFQWDAVPVSYDFRWFPQAIAYQQRSSNQERVADYDYLANASEGVQWLGALRMDVDNLGAVFSQKLGKATPSRLATLSAALRLFFEGYVPQLCREYNADQEQEILELIYAGGDDLFLVGGWSALPKIAERIRSEFREFVTGDHVTLSGGIAVEHKKFPLYQFAAQSGKAEEAAKGLPKKNAITFLQKPITWKDFETVRNWHNRFLGAMRAERNALPSAFLTRLNQIYADEKSWAWRSLYYFSRLQQRYRAQDAFLQELQQALNFETATQLREFIQIITRWTTLHIRNEEDQHG